LRATGNQSKAAFQQFYQQKKIPYHVVKSNGGAAITQDESMLLNILAGTNMLDFRLTDIPTDPIVKLLPG